jgi:hypothetical protein
MQLVKKFDYLCLRLILKYLARRYGAVIQLRWSWLDRR